MACAVLSGSELESQPLTTSAMAPALNARKPLPRAQRLLDAFFDVRVDFKVDERGEDVAGILAVTMKFLSTCFWRIRNRRQQVVCH